MRPNAIRLIGLQKYLDETTTTHNGFGYDAFTRMMEASKRPGTASVARIMNITVPTATKYVEIYDEEKVRV